MVYLSILNDVGSSKKLEACDQKGCERRSCKLTGSNLPGVSETKPTWISHSDDASRAILKTFRS